MTDFITTLPQAVNSALGLSSDDMIGGLLLSTLILIAIVLVCNATKSIKMPGLLVVLISAATLLALMSWLPTWIPMLIVVAVLGLFGVKIMKGLG